MTIKDYILMKFPANGHEIIELYNIKFDKLMADVKDRSENQKQTLKNTILPRVALYKILLETDCSQADAHDIVKDYLHNYVSKEMNKKLRMLDKMPFSFALFRKQMAKKIETSDNWDTTLVKNEKDELSFDIHKCLWYDTCVENGCEELCDIFCDVDYLIYEGMTKYVFKRTGTIALGAKKCDFHYCKIKK